MNIHKDLNSILTKNSIDVVKIIPCQEAPKKTHESRFGGKPYWPKAKKYPKTKAGEPLFLFAQLNFEEMPNVDLYPTSGILQFYITDDHLHGLDFDTPLNQVIDLPERYRVVYHDEVLSEPDMLKHDVPDTCKLDGFPVDSVLSLAFRVEQELPGDGEYHFFDALDEYGKIDDDSLEEVSDYLLDNIDATGSKLGGNAFFTQHDPRKSKNISEYWTLLFQMDSINDHGVKINWGDLGVANFFIKPQALSDRDFSNVWYNWDCF